MQQKRITWAEAERLFPGVRAEWSEMTRAMDPDEEWAMPDGVIYRGRQGYRLGPHLAAPGAVEVWLLEFNEWVKDQILEVRTCLDDQGFPVSPFPGEGSIGPDGTVVGSPVAWAKGSPCWRRWSEPGRWTCPIPLTARALYRSF